MPALPAPADAVRRCVENRPLRVETVTRCRAYGHPAFSVNALGDLAVHSAVQRQVPGDKEQDRFALLQQQRGSPAHVTEILPRDEGGPRPREEAGSYGHLVSVRAGQTLYGSS